VPATYTNPIHPANFPDPFVLRFNGRYYAYATGPAGDGRFFPMLSSTNLVDWQPHGGALEPLRVPGAEEYWAPEVAYSEGTFYLYYATGRTADPDHHLRVATAEHPLGPWRDAGLNLTPHELFAIDAHPFRDPRDGAWYLFYARDNLEPPFAGTGLAVDRLVDMTTLAGEPREVLRPYADWQVFELKRAVKKGLDWHTIEGPFVVRHEDQYVCFYSGGRWENPNYGVGYALAEAPLGRWVDDANRDGPTVLRTNPRRVIGPGHNSVVIGPDLVTPYLVYHGWDPDCTARLPRIDRLEWRDGRPFCDGPTSEPQRAPRPPDVAAWYDAGEHGHACEPTSACHPGGSSLVFTERGRIRVREAWRDFVLEIAVRFSGPLARGGVLVGELELCIGEGALWAGEKGAPLPVGFRPEAWHRLTVRRAAGHVSITLDEFPTVSTADSGGAVPVAVTGEPGMELSHLAVTRLG
jgi:GH43 family beta-xylosidase